MLSSISSYRSISHYSFSDDDVVMEPVGALKAEEFIEPPLLKDYPEVPSSPLIDSPLLDDDSIESVDDIFKRAQEARSSSGRSKKSGRTFIPKTANVDQTQEDKEAGTCSDKTVINHAGERVVNFRLVAECIKKLNITSTGEKRNLTIRIVSALYQGGKGTTVNKIKYHAAHDAADSGLLIDARAHFINRILETGQISPNTKGFMKMRGISDSEFKVIEAALTDKNIESVFDVIWPVHPRQPDYLFEGTKLNEKVNRTTELLIGINLFVDKKLEAYIRPVIIELYQKVIDGDLCPKQAEKEYVTAITYFFTKLENNLKLSLSLIEQYQKEFVNIGDFCSVEAEKCKATLNNLNALMSKLCPKKPKKEATGKSKKKAKGKSKKKAAVEAIEVKDDSKVVETPPVPATKTVAIETMQIDSKMINPRMNREFIRQNNLEKDIPELLPNMLRGVENWGKRRGSQLLAEMQTFYKKVESYIKFVVLEKEGTAELTDEQTLALFGEFNPLSGKRELTDETVKAACERLWSPPTPEKKLVRARDENVDPNSRPAKRPRKGVRINLAEKFEKLT